MSDRQGKDCFADFENYTSQVKTFVCSWLGEPETMRALLADKRFSKDRVSILRELREKAPDFVPALQKYEEESED